MEGQTNGRRKGLQDGLHLGCQKGVEIGAEVSLFLSDQKGSENGLKEAFCLFEVLVLLICTVTELHFSEEHPTNGYRFQRFTLS